MQPYSTTNAGIVVSLVEHQQQRAGDRELEPGAERHGARPKFSRHRAVGAGYAQHHTGVERGKLCLYSVFDFIHTGTLHLFIRFIWSRVSQPRSISRHKASPSRPRPLLFRVRCYNVAVRGLSVPSQTKPFPSSQSQRGSDAPKNFPCLRSNFHGRPCISRGRNSQPEKGIKNGY